MAFRSGNAGASVDLGHPCAGIFRLMATFHRSALVLACTIATAVIFVPVPVASAQSKAGQPTFEFQKPEEEQKKLERVEWKAQLQSGLVLTTGNARTTTFSAGGNASRRDRRNRLRVDATATYVRSELFLAIDQNGDMLIQEGEITRSRQTTAKAWEVRGRYDRFLTEHNSLYGLGFVSADEPAGKELIGGGQAGYSRQLYKSDDHELVAEGGYDFTYENYLTDDVDDAVVIHSGRAFAGYTGKVREETQFSTSVETLVNVNDLDTPTGPVARFHDVRMTGKAELTTQLWEKVSFSFSFTAKWDNAPAPRAPFALPYAPGFNPMADELDTITKASLIINLL